MEAKETRNSTQSKRMKSAIVSVIQQHNNGLDSLGLELEDDNTNFVIDQNKNNAKIARVFNGLCVCVCHPA